MYVLISMDTFCHDFFDLTIFIFLYNFFYIVILLYTYSNWAFCCIVIYLLFFGDLLPLDVVNFFLQNYSFKKLRRKNKNKTQISFLSCMSRKITFTIVYKIKRTQFEAEEENCGQIMVKVICQAYKEVSRQITRQVDKQICRWIKRWINRQINRQIDKQKVRQIDKQL